MPHREKKVIAVLPAYNAERTLKATYDDIPKDWVDEILLVDDCSRDPTVEPITPVRLHVASWRWEGVPFFVRAGKCLPTTTTEVLVTLKRPPLRHVGPEETNHVRFRLSPDVDGVSRGCDEKFGTFGK